ncbi:AbrB family transcriptional regulator [Caldicellulosiruptor bescii]|uniref:Transcriptional regulator, AbrB family n=4 Tax=Caldicellulosiruptor TaxID=44000 RepID=B9MP55_CALBD|nr:MULTISPECIES: AbrB/MazE/SpoVT family DNA-binding domain-containing protein [Caldicellulosiruptor]ACM61614.1 transcriptional regulator, AbrB family [Caldicellulosiruptor bescii DSM 6725]ADQ41647.1 transcriptional regulator, AbrB family [Caldicellulosiruptor acetigenus I77R1B]AZT89465.1 AbrB/MazE/SpoVT family DNA-binding domain-containing protein [Caldicellulosiruptor changbaiensis]PBC88577.1 AbrB family transcriptional regulator [Caldicellulosiruptor bescii]PBC91942.1 AbrB family transcripti
MVIVEIKKKSQVTIPAQILKKLNLRVGDLLQIEEKDGRIILTPVIAIPKEQAWFYSEKWQREEATVEKEIQEGKLLVANSLEELFDDLGLNDE